MNSNQPEDKDEVTLTGEQFNRLMTFQTKWLLARGALIALRRPDVVISIEGKSVNVQHGELVKRGDDATAK
jgi:hypothetical protein